MRFRWTCNLHSGSASEAEYVVGYDIGLWVPTVPVHPIPFIFVVVDVELSLVNDHDAILATGNGGQVAIQMPACS